MKRVLLPVALVAAFFVSACAGLTLDRAADRAVEADGAEERSLRFMGLAELLCARIAVSPAIGAAEAELACRDAIGAAGRVELAAKGALFERTIEREAMGLLGRARLLVPGLEIPEGKVEALVMVARALRQLSGAAAALEDLDFLVASYRAGSVTYAEARAVLGTEFARSLNLISARRG